MEQLSKERLARADLQAQLDRLNADHKQCGALIAALRKQMQEMKDALEQDDDTLEKNKSKAVEESAALEKQLQCKLSNAPTPAKSGRVKLGAAAPAPGAGGGLPLPLPVPEKDEAAQVEDMKGKAVTLSGIAKLRAELSELKKTHAKCDAAVAAKDDEIKMLKQHLARLDAKLAEELEKEAAMAKQLAEEQRKEAELASNLESTKAALAKDEKALAEDRKEFADKDAEIADLKQQLAALEAKTKTRLADVGAELSQLQAEHASALDKLNSKSTCKDDSIAKLNSRFGLLLKAHVGFIFICAVLLLGVSMLAASRCSLALQTVCAWARDLLSLETD